MASGKKIVIVDNAAWSIFNFHLSLIKKLTSLGYQVIIATPVDEYISKINKNYYKKYIPLKYLNPQRKSPLRELLFIKELHSLFKKEQPGLVINYTIKPIIFGNIAARLASVPTISFITGLGYTFLNPSLVNGLIRKLYKWSLKKTERLIVLNQDDFKIVTKNKPSLTAKTIIFPGTGINTNFFRPLPNSRQDEKFVFLFIGRLLYDKGIREFVEAAKQVRKICKKSEFWVVGDLNHGNPSTVSKEAFLKWTESKTIRYFGTTKQIRKFIKQSDVVVLPSYREGVPRSIMEGMSMEKPIITTNVAGCRDTVVNNVNGYIVPPKDASALTQAMMKIYNLSDDELLEMGSEGRRLVLEKFDEKIIVSSYLKLLNEIFAVEERKKRSSVFSHNLVPIEPVGAV